MERMFRDRFDAGRALAERLNAYAGRPDLLVLALPRGGVPVGVEVARGLHAPLDLFLVRKLGVPGHEELAMGAIASGGVRILNDEVLQLLRIPAALVEGAAAEQLAELQKRERAYRGDRPPPVVANRTVILVDDGIATGASMRAAVEAIRAQHPAALVVAVPVAARGACEAFRDQDSDFVCLLEPPDFQAVSQGYQHFTQVSDDEVRSLLAQAEASYHSTAYV